MLASNGSAKTKNSGDRIGLMNKFCIVYGAYERISITGAGGFVFFGDAHHLIASTMLDSSHVSSETQTSLRQKSSGKNASGLSFISFDPGVA